MAAKKSAASMDARPDFSLEARERAFNERETTAQRERAFGERPYEDEDDDEPSFEIKDPYVSERAAVKTGALNKDLQVLTLLNTLGERLVRSEKERAAIQSSMKDYQRIVAQLEAKSEKTEASFSALIERQKQIEELQRKQLERLEKAASYADRIEEALAQQARLHRRLDKITQDKAGFIRKLESIEESVIETQTALRLYAVPALRPDAPPPAAPAKPSAPEKTKSKNFLRAAMTRQYAGIAAGVVVAFLLGFIVLSPPVAPPTIEEQVSGLAQSNVIINESADTAETTADLNAQETFDENSAATQSAQLPDALNASAEELSQSFDENPEELAAALNAIEPGLETNVIAASELGEDDLEDYVVNENAPSLTTPDTPAALAALEEPAPLPQVSSAPAATLEQPAAEEPSKAQGQQAAQSMDAASLSQGPANSFLATQAISGKIESRIERDKKLPNLIRDIEKQAFAGNIEAQHDLAAIYTAGHGGVEVDYTRAALWFREAALQGVANARYNLGVLYHQGLGVEKNIANAMGWYHAAAALNHPEAQYNLGIAHIEGIGTSYSAEKAAIYFRDSARGGVMEAAYNLGLIHENGLLGKHQPEEAIFWYKQSAEAGSPEAAAAMNQLIRAMKMDDATVERIIKEGKAREAASLKKKDNLGEQAATQSVMPQSALPAITNAPPTNTPSATSVAAALLESAYASANADNAPTSSAAPVRDYAMIANVQQELIRRNLLPADIDPADLARTEDAVRIYQRKNGLAQDGKITDALLLHMIENSNPSSGANAQPLMPADLALPDYNSY